ncbi:unnamed protein product, partial [marine sediment metagenome]
DVAVGSQADCGYSGGNNRGDSVTVQNWCDAPEIHPSQIRVGDIIGTLRETTLRYTVKMVSVPHSAPRRWTFFGRDDKGLDYANVFGENDLVRRYGKV